jgi:hypothetical protein
VPQSLGTTRPDRQIGGARHSKHPSRSGRGAAAKSVSMG